MGGEQQYTAREVYECSLVINWVKDKLLIWLLSEREGLISQKSRK